jgi:hypothetical protein
MEFSTAALCKSLLFLAALFTFSCLSPEASAQEKPPADKKAAPAAKFPAAKRQAPEPSPAEADGDSDVKQEGKIDQDSSEAIRRREEWFYRQRVFPNPALPAGARLRAYQHKQRMMEAEGKLVRRLDGTMQAVDANITLGSNWTPLGPKPTTGGLFSPVSGRITSIAVDPSDVSGNTVLIGGAQGGIWRSVDAGVNWTAVGDANASLAMGSIAFAPSAVGTVYAGTGEQASVGFDVYYGAGVLKSADHGQTWTQTCTVASMTCPFIGPYDVPNLGFGFYNDGGARISYVSVNPANANLVLVGAQIPRVGTSLSETAGGIFCSDDGGATWSGLLVGGAGSFVGFANATTAYAAIGRPAGSTTGVANGIYKSVNADGGGAKKCSAITFTAVTAPTSQAMGRIDLGIFDASTVYASIANGAAGSNTNLGVWVTTNGGTSWTLTGAPDICQHQCWYDNVIKADPNNKDIVYFGGAAVVTAGPTFAWVVRSVNGSTGGAFSAAIPNSQNGGDATLPHVDEHAMAFVRLPSTKVRLYLGGDGGLWRTDDAEASTVTWINLNQNLTLTQFYPGLSFSSANPNLLYDGAQDNGSQFYNGGVSWVDNDQCGDGGETTVDPNVPTVVYATCQDININVSPSGGQDPSSFALSINGINPNGSDAVNFIPPIAADASNTGRAYFGTDHVYQTNDFGATWTAISGALPGATAYLTTVASAPKNSAVVYAGSNSGLVFIARNVTAGGQALFTQIGAGVLPVRTVTAVVPDPNDATGLTAYAIFSGFAVGTDTKGHIFRTANGGTSWTDVSCSAVSCITPALTDLPNIPVNDLVVDPDVPGTLYAATDLGVYATTDGGGHWATLDSGLPNVAVLSLRLHEASRTLLASTHGRGAWSLVLSNFTFTGPHVGELTPTTANAGSATATILIDGSGLAGGAVKWDGSATGVTTISATAVQAQASISSSLLTGGGTHKITVVTGAGTSNALTFSVLGGAPTITSVNPVSANVNAANTPITVTGTNFGTTSQVILNPDASGTAIATTFTDSTHLSAVVPASFMANFGSTNSVGVHSPPPGGGTTVTTQTVTLPTFKVIAPAPTNDNFASAINITTNAFTDTRDSSGATMQTSDPIPACAQNVQVGFTTGTSNTIWYKFTPTSNGTITDVDTIGSSYDSVLSIWTGSASSLTAFACNDDINPGIVIQSQLTNLVVTAGTTYYIMVSSFGPADPNPIALGGQSTLNFQFTPSAAAPTITSISPNNTTAGGSSFVLNVTGTNFVAGATVKFGTNPALTPSSIAATVIMVTVPASDIATAGTPGVTVTTSGGTSNSVTFTVNAATTGTFTVAGTAVTVTAGTSQTSTITVTPSGGFTGTVNVTCPAAGLPPQGETPPTTTCSPNPLAIVVTAGAKTGQLTVAVPAPSTNLTASSAPDERTLYAAGLAPSSRGRGWWMLSAGAGLTAMLLLILPGRKRYRAALGLGLVCVLSFTLGCGGSGGGTSGPVVTQTKISVNSAKLASSDPTGFKFTITVTASVGANGQVQLFDGSSMLGSATSVSNGTTTITSAGLAPGTHSISAHYLGDSATQASQSGMLNVTSTGTTTFVVSTQPAASNGTPTVSITIN